MAPSLQRAPPSLACDYFKLTETEGRGTGESLVQFPVEAGDYILADRGYSTGQGIAHVVAAGGQVTVRVNTHSLLLRTAQGQPFDLMAAVTSLKRVGAVQSWSAQVGVREGLTVPGRVCAIRKTQEAIKMAQAKIRSTALRKGKQVHPRTLRFARYVILFTTFPESAFTASEVLQWYRVRWQVELIFKRFKSLAQLGHLPKYDDASAKAWLYGKLLVALLVEKLIHHAVAISPGDTTWRQHRPHSAWRDFKFVLNQVTRALEPDLPLGRMIGEWNEISKSLAEPPRRRLSQLSGYFE